MSTHRLFIQDGPDVSFKATRLVVASWTCRKETDTTCHIEERTATELRHISGIPGFRELSPSVVTTSNAIEFAGECSSGEVAAVLLYDEVQGLLVGVGSDHTDRRPVQHDAAFLNRMRAKPLGADIWRYDEVIGHWDEIVARSWCIDEQGARTLYQEGALAGALSADDVLDKVSARELVRPGTVIFCCTQPFIAEFSPAIRFEVELFDPILQRTLRHGYAVNALAHAE